MYPWFNDFQPGLAPPGSMPPLVFMASAQGPMPAHGLMPALGSMPALGPTPAQASMPAQGPMPAHGLMPALGSTPALGPTPAQASMPAQGPMPAHGLMPALGSMPALGPTPAQASMPAQGLIPALGVSATSEDGMGSSHTSVPPQNRAARESLAVSPVIDRTEASSDERPAKRPRGDQAVSEQLPRDLLRKADEQRQQEREEREQRREAKLLENKRRREIQKRYRWCRRGAVVVYSGQNWTVKSIFRGAHSTVMVDLAHVDLHTKQTRRVDILELAPMTLSVSLFKREYTRTRAPRSDRELKQAVDAILDDFYSLKDVDPARQQRFRKELHADMLDHWDTGHPEQVKRAAQCLWTSTATVKVSQGQRMEFCNILNYACRNDCFAKPLAVVVRAVNALQVDQEYPIHPASHRAYRGGGFDDAFRAFFEAGMKFRQPAFLASSFSKRVAKKFLEESPSAIMWEIEIDRAQKCRHVNLVQNSVVEGEQEYLFVPYSAFTVRKVRWAAGTTKDPHWIVLTAAVDNLAACEELPLAPCS